MAEWHERVAALKAANPQMTSKQMAAAVGKSAAAVRAALKRLRDREDDGDVTGVTVRVTPERNVTPTRVLDADEIDMTSLLRVARDTAIEIMNDRDAPVQVRAGTAVQVLNGIHGKALADAVARAQMPTDEEGQQLALPEHVEEIIVAMRRRTIEQT
jgi:DNA-binding Lrp family transcriptional regulator